jgi:hypothetical protein
MRPRRSTLSLLFLILTGLVLMACASCMPAATQSPAEEQPAPQTGATSAPPAPTQSTRPIPTSAVVMEERLVEMEWPEYMRRTIRT